MPTPPQNITYRPLNKGMFLHLPAEAIPDEAVVRARNVRVTPLGIQRRDGYASYAGSTAVPTGSRPLYAFVPVWKTDGTQFNALLTNKYVYGVGLATLTPYYWPYSTGKIKTSSGVYLKGQATTFTNPANYLRVGDIVVISTASAAVSTVNNATLITLATSVATFAISTAYHIRRALNHNDTWSYDTAVIGNTAIISDRTRPLYVFTGVTLSNYMVSPYRPGCVTIFKDRMFIGNVVESISPGATSEYRQRIRWSGVTGTPRSFAAADYLDLEYTPGALLRHVPMGNLLIAYFQDALYYGVPTNNPDLPYSFNRIETPGIGLAGPHAVCQGPGGHYFAGTDDIYFLPADPRGGPQSIGVPVVEESIATCENKLRIYAAPDPLRHRVVFGFPITGSNIARIWSFDLRSKAWSYEDVEADMLANPLLNLNLTIADLTGTITGLDASYTTIDSMTAVGGSNDLFIGQSGTLYKAAEDASTDTWGTPTVEVITGDKDLGDPGIDKTFLELWIRLSGRPSTALTFAVSASDNGGISWSGLGNLTVAATEREGRVAFAFTGASVRFRLISTTAATPYTIISLQLRIKGRGKGAELD